MSDASEPAGKAGWSRLSEAIRDVKNAAADRGEVVVELREAQRTRLELLAAELADVFQDVPADADIFDFAISSGLQPRLWIDSISHVTMGRDRRTYRFLKDTRLGRVVLAESTEIKPVADQVARYVAGRMIERERIMEGPVEEAVMRASPPVLSAAGARARNASSAWTAALLVLLGVVFGVGITVLILWDRLAQLGISL